jgi:hypothetical protein
MCVGVLCRCYICIDWATTFSGGGGLPLAKIIGQSGVYPDHMFCNYNRLDMMCAKRVPNNRHIKNKIKSSGYACLVRATPVSASALHTQIHNTIQLEH